jgi:hypothetical protein
MRHIAFLGVVGLFVAGISNGRASASVMPGLTFTVASQSGLPATGTHYHSNLAGVFGNPPGLAEVGSLQDQALSSESIRVPPDDSSQPGRAHRAGAPPRDPLSQAHSPARHRCRRRHARLGEQWVFSRRQCSDHAHRPRRAQLFSESRTPVALLRPAPLRARATLCDT